MDIFSHALLGRLCAIGASRKEKICAAFTGFAPDLLQFILYPIVGYYHGHLWSDTADWVGFRAGHPYWTLLWEIPHSLFMLPIVYIFFKRYTTLSPVLMTGAYASHLITDLFTHTGEWSVKMFWPIQYMVEGHNDMWAWKFYYYPLVWVSIILLMSILERIIKKRNTD